VDPSDRTFKDDKRIPIVLKGSFEKSSGKAGARATGERAQIPEHDGDYMCVFGYKDDRGREKTGSFNVEAPWTPELRRILENCRNLQDSTSSGTHNFAKSICEIGRLDGKDFTVGLTLHITLIWKNSHSLEDARMDELNDLLKLVTPGGRQYSVTTGSQDRFSPRDFYDSVYVPPKDMETSDTIESNQLTCHLYPFQKRAVQWLFLRECHEQYKAPVRTPSQSGFIIKVPPRDSSQTDVSAAERDTETSAQTSPCGDLPHGFFSTKDADGQECFVSHWLGIVTTDKSLISSLGTNLSGGILAEEMGLGKTVEMIGLICLHQRPESQIPEQLTDERTRMSRATLVITPPSILQQWKTEIHVHAPSLRVMIYEGITRAETDDDTVAKLLEYDIVLSTYQIIGKEIHYTTPDRTLRHEKRYEKRKSPLVRINWWRVVLDECQMVESGVSNAARVARMIPRRNAWAVSGTPLKKDAQDLFGLLLFLDLKPYCFSAPLWESLVTNYKPVFKQLVGAIALRHTKAQVKGDIKLPPQKRVVLTIPFTHIEEQHYSTLCRRMCEDCNVDSEGSPAVDDWSPESYATKMRQWLTRLRQTCLHPAVGYQNSRELGRHLGGTGPLRTVKQVLQVMINQNEAARHTAERSYLQAKLRRGQYLERDNRTQAALTIWLEVLDYANKMVRECRLYLQSIKESDHRSTSADSEINDDSSGDDEPLEDSNGRTQVSSRLRSALELAHTSTFFAGNAYFQIKSDPQRTLKDSERYKELDRAETETYEKAKQLRKEILKEASSKVENLMAKIHSKAKKQEFTQIPNFRPLAFSGGIESRNLLMRLGDLCEAVNVQAEIIDEWREKLVELLLQPLVDQEEVEIQGDEYESSTKQQEEIYAYMEVLRAVIADRHDALTGQTNVLVRGEMAFALNRATNGEGHAPRLMLRLLRKRDKAKPETDLGSIRGIITMLRVLKARLQGQEENGSQRVAAELEIVTQALAKLQKDATKQATAVTNLERELDTFRETMNARLDYYRQLQIISDAVAPLNEIADDRLQGHIDEQSANEARLLGQIATQKARGRYLLNLQEEPAMGITERTCIICTETFVIGLLTSCGHSYCKVCFKAWYRDNRNCPICKTYLQEKEIRQIT
jgi:E3 ubiquitin-protein ligase SHPRH